MILLNKDKKDKNSCGKLGNTSKLIFVVDYFGNVDITENAKLFVESTSQ